MKAHHEPDATGTLVVEADPDDAAVTIDDGEPRTAGAKIKLPIGIHLVMVTAADRAPYAELVDVQQDKPFHITISLDQETKIVRAARLVDESAATPPGKARLKRARALSKLTGVGRLLFVEDGTADHVIVRLYDINLKKVSKSVELDSSASSASIARDIKAALDPDNLVDASSVVVQMQYKPEPMHWYNHWYVWAGAAALLGGGIAGYELMSREPTAVRGFQ
jgi:hypothetical protein